MTTDRDLPAAYLALRRATDGILREVVELHQPTFFVAWQTCRGCDAGAHAEEPAEWPCSTVELVASRLGVSLRDEDYTVEQQA